MGHVAPKVGDFGVDLECGGIVAADDSSKKQTSGSKLHVKALVPEISAMCLDGSIKHEVGVNVDGHVKGFSADIEKGTTVDDAERKVIKEKRQKMSNKKPPRPPRGLSLDSTDQKFIKELSELSMQKYARIERMKALKKMKATKASSSGSNLLATLFTLLFFLVIIFQGMSSRGPSISQSSAVSVGAVENGLISVHYLNPSASESKDHASVSSK
ncbi:hypothetical protein K2173_018884 [Erythroxylum novogranatense]|uniref:Transmembrane protein n=1 Tax=Erythroxylum novogranatense TaxID=1862640 RepID=A0AAV8SBG4_9ROSI|nr:hypothetical protein K2173_018884 [Erythroxylum novogranatense]